MPRILLVSCLFTVCGLFAAGRACALDRVSLTRDGLPLHLEGKVLVEAQDGGLLLLDAQGVLWSVQPDELQDRTSDGREFALLDRDGLAAALLAELPEGFRIHSTAHYVICYNTSEEYARWCGALFERLHRGFFGYWKNQGLELAEPQTPLPAVVFDSKQAYTDYAAQELGEASARAISFGYYSLRSNRVAMYDLTGADDAARSSRAGTLATINRLLAQPGAEFNVATIVHEATHQLAFNSGLQTRYADIPLWVSEGMAIYFETPDLRSSRGWRTIGAVNHRRLNTFRLGLSGRPENSLETMLADHARFRDTSTAAEAYAEAWALNYYLIKTRTDDYVRYMRLLAEKQPLVSDDPAARLEEFKSIFGDDLNELDAEFLKYMQRLR